MKRMNKKINNSWDEYLKDEFEAPYFKEIEKRVDEEYSLYTCFPEKEDIFNAFKSTPLEMIKVVILGQDPYHNDKEAMGLSFSVPKDVNIPPSLVNIYKELKEDIGMDIPKYGDLSPLTQEGVFLLNSILSVRKGQALSHQSFGWEKFTDQVISIINKRDTPTVFLLWGRNARNKKYLISNPIHLVLEAAHPSPLSAYNGFFHSHHFSKANDFLMRNEINPVDWEVLE